MTDHANTFQAKYNEFVEDVLGALPEYTAQITVAKGLEPDVRLKRFQEEVKVNNTFGSVSGEDSTENPGAILPGVVVEDTVWRSLSENTKKAIWEHLRIVSICCFMEVGFSDGEKPAWMSGIMDDAMKEMSKKLEGLDFQDLIKKFMGFFKSNKDDTNATAAGAGAGAGAAAEDLPKGLEGIFENGFPKIPEKFLKGHMAKLAQEIVKDITPEDLGISGEMIAECEKNPSRAFDILFSVFGNNPAIIQNTIQKIGKRLQQKIASGAIRPQEIAREAEELMKEFANNTSFVDMLSGLKGAFGFEDMDLARQAGKEGSARLSIARERLRKKLDKKKQAQAQTPSSNK
jgi:hypothetical protein